MTIREALGGPWAGHWMLLVALLPPTTLMVVLRESVTPFPEWWWPLVSAVTQHLVAAAVVVGGVAIARRVHPVLPIATSLAIWSLGAALRGVVAGSIAQQVAGVSPEFMTRVGVWWIVSLVWMPVLVYAVAQAEHRRLIIGALDLTYLELEREHVRSTATGAEVQQRLRQAIAESLSPALSELRLSLEASRSALDRASVAELSLRLSQLHDDTADLLDSAHEPESSEKLHRATLRRALDLPPRRLWLIALLVAVATTTLLVFDTWRIFGHLAAIEVVISIVAASIVIALVPAIVAFMRVETVDHASQRTTGAASLLAITVAVYLLLNSGIDPITWHGLLIVPLLITGLAAASAAFLASIALAGSNDEAATRLAGVRHELAKTRELNERRFDDERQRLSQLMHGPVQGRIAACIMALNFYASAEAPNSPESGDASERETRELTDSVLNHLRSVSHDLAQITEGIRRPAP